MDDHLSNNVFGINFKKFIGSNEFVVSNAISELSGKVLLFNQSLNFHFDGTIICFRMKNGNDPSEDTIVNFDKFPN